jgi:catechol 2,3-dioxygenase-like lactoylglutathione lyase family enzyme
MLKEVVYVALLVSDQDKALDFYTTDLEAKLAEVRAAGATDEPRFSVLTLGVENL